MRIDTLLHRLRFAKTRGLAQRWIGEGHMRVNGQRICKNDRSIAVGDVLTLPLASRVAVIAIEVLPERRGPPDEARACYRTLDGGPPAAIAGRMPHGAAPPAEGH